MALTLNDLWIFIIAAVGLIASIVTIISFTKSKKKNLTLKLLCNSPILTVNDTYRQKISVTFNGIDVKHVYRFAFVIRNTGNITITKDEFETPLKIVFSNGLKILDINSDAKFPEDIDIDYKIENSSIIIKPFMLNSGEYIVFDIILDNENHDFTVLGRIKEVTEFNIIKPMDTQKSTWTENFPITLITFGLAYTFASIPFLIQQKSILSNILPLAIGLISVIGGGITLLNRKYAGDEEIFYLLQANKWIDVQINKIKF